MIESIKKMFTKKASSEGSLKVQEEEFKNITITLEGQNINITQYDPPSIPISAISDLQFNHNTLSFIFDNKKFSLELSNGESIYQKLKPLVTDKFIFKASDVKYYIYNSSTRKFEKSDGLFTVKIIFDSNYFIRIEDDRAIQHYEQIGTNTQYYMDQTNHSFVWSVFNEGIFHTFCIEFSENLSFLEFSSKYVECCYRTVNYDVPGGDFKYFENIAFISNNPLNNKNNKNNDPLVNNKTNNDPIINNNGNDINEEDDWMDFEDEEPINSSFNKDDNQNKHLIMGNNQVFITRGSSLGVFDIDRDDLKFRTHIQNTLDDPKKIITHSGEQNLLILDKDKRDTLQILDLNRGEIIERWDVDENMNDYFHGTKYNNEGTLIGVSDYSLFRIDPRMKDKIAEKNTYKTKNEFSCGIATDRGDVAVASSKGDLRLYNKIDKRAKSLLPGFGDEIIGIDSSKDGSMILCTCKNYILMFNVGADYSKPVGKDKPAPKRLQLKPQHLSLIKEEILFTTAKFDQDDSVIVTSTGRFVVKWSVSDVKNGDIYNYSLKALYDVIVDENFIRNGDDIVVALPNDVKKVTEKDLRKPRYN